MLSQSPTYREVQGGVKMALTAWFLIYGGATAGRSSVIILIASQAASVQAAGGEESTGPRCPSFEGINAAFMPWFIAFSAWVAWKKPELSALILGTSKRPRYAQPVAPTPAERKRRTQWDIYNTQLYGAIVSHVATHIQTSLHLEHAGNGVKALRYLKNKYGAHSTGDRAEAIARLQRSVIDPRAKISEDEVTRQYTAMSMAVNDIVATGGAKIDDATLISMLENALPPAYAAIRQMLRYHQHTAFDTYFNDLRTQVKAEERSSQAMVPAAFAVGEETPTAMTIAQNNQGHNYGRGGRQFSQNGAARGKGKGGKGRKQGETSLNPCFNCGKCDHPRFHCPCPTAVCAHCGANHLSEMCSKGPGGPLRDALSYNAKLALERIAAKQLQSKSDHQGQAHSATEAGGANNTQGISQPPKAYLTGKRPASTAFSDNQRIEYSSGSGRPPPLTGGEPPSQRRSMNVGSSSSHVPDLQEIDEFLASYSARSFMVRQSDEGGVNTNRVVNSLHTVAYIDSQATAFVVPDEGYLTRVTDASPLMTVDTAGGPTRPEAIGEMVISLFDDGGKWHSFTIGNVWVIKSCNRVLYSQSVMKNLGVIHRLDEGFIEFRDGSRKSVSSQTYAVELTFGRVDNSAMVTRHPALRLHSEEEARGSGDSAAPKRQKAAIPQQLVWQRLGCPNVHVWTHITDVICDHGLPPTAHLKHDFQTSEAVTKARSRLKAFNHLQEPEQLPAPGAVIYMDFAGPMTESFPHKFVYYCGAVDAGSSFARVVPCHMATKEVAQQCLELLLADLRAHMGLTHKIQPHVVVTDQGSQFMSKYFTDFLAGEQAVHRPAVTYTPQQNALVERMWGTRFAIARTLLKLANLGPAFHPFAVQTANWIANRTPLPWRSNLSAAYILCRRVISMAYLKVFGSLTRITIPWARRVGDKHFADRGLLGIYLGPSEKSPGCIVYVPSTRQFYTSRDVICYEDVQPGIRGVDSSWRDLPDTSEAATTTVQSGVDQAETEATKTTEPQLPDGDPFLSRSVTSQSAPVEAPPTTALGDEPSDISLGDVGTTGGPSNDHQASGDDSVPQPSELLHESSHSNREDEASPIVNRRLPVTDTADPEDPSSRLYRRQLPARSTRYTGAYYCDPTTASIQQTIRNAICMAMYTHDVPILGEIQFYESSVSGTDRVFAVTSTVDLGDIVIPRSYNQALRSPEASYWKDAISKELDGLIKIGTFEFIPASSVPGGANIMRCHMVFTVKRLADGTVEKFKCRLVADGNTQRWGVDFDKVFSTVAKLATLRLVLTIAAAFDYNLSSADIRQAYLQAVLSEDLYMIMPPGLPTEDADGNPLVVRLKRSLYGLKQAGREWHQLFTSTLINWGFVQSQIDTCLFTFSRGQSLIWLVIWVDDCVIIDNDDDLRREFIDYLSGVHPTEDKGELNWVLQVKLTRDRVGKSIVLSQELYVKDLVNRFASHLQGLTRRFDSPFDANLDLSADQCPELDTPEYTEMYGCRDAYMSLVGAYLWLANVTRPELCYIAAQLARYVSNPGKAHYKAALRVLIYLDNTSSKGLVIKPNPDLGLRVFVDANWSAQFSISGGLVDYMGVPVHWLSKTQRSVSMSSTEAEYFAASLIAREVLFFRELVKDLGHMQMGPTRVYTDNKGVVDLSSDPVAFRKTKHILRATQFVRDLCMRRVLSLEWIPGAQNPADLFTKAFALPAFRRLCGYLTTLAMLPN